MKGLSALSPGSPGGIILFLVLCFLVSTSAVSESATITKRVQPGWVTDLALPSSGASVGMESGGVDYLLYDIQTDLRDAKAKEYFRIASQIRNEEGLRELSSISVVFDPDYESLSFHSLRIHRGDRVIDRLEDAQFQILQRESKLERQIYDGSLTAHLILEDLRVGDVVEYSFSREGNNPVFDGRFSRHYSVQWQVPLLRHRLRFLTDEGNPLHIQPSNPNFRFTRTVDAGTVEYVLRQEAPEARPVEGGAPSWYRRFASVSVSQFQSWEDVQQWAAPLYALPTPVSEEVREIAETIAQKHQTPEQRLQAALDFVQRDIRYVGIEMGAHSYQPRPPKKFCSAALVTAKTKRCCSIHFWTNWALRPTPFWLIPICGTKSPSPLPRLSRSTMSLPRPTSVIHATGWMAPTPISEELLLAGPWRTSGQAWFLTGKTTASRPITPIRQCRRHPESILNKSCFWTRTAISLLSCTSRPR